MLKVIYGIVNGISEMVTGLTISMGWNRKKESLGGQLSQPMIKMESKRRVGKQIVKSKPLNKGMATVIPFPNNKVRTNHPDLSDEQRKMLLIQEKIDGIENALEYVTMESISMVHRLGYDITREDMVKDITLIVDSFRSLMYRATNMKHPIQDFVQEKYIMEGGDAGDGNEYAICPEWQPKVTESD